MDDDAHLRRAFRQSPNRAISGIPIQVPHSEKMKGVVENRERQSFKAYAFAKRKTPINPLEVSPTDTNPARAMPRSRIRSVPHREFPSGRCDIPNWTAGVSVRARRCGDQTLCLSGRHFVQRPLGNLVGMTQIRDKPRGVSGNYWAALKSVLAKSFPLKSRGSRDAFERA
jgi:hypothetical protein